jgi:DNA-binding transcriptional regulator YhcF (GntR family)
MNKLAQSNPFALDHGSEVPLGVQLGWRFRALIATGRLAAGERLPSLRRVAEWAGVNVNTVRGVYESLEERGLVATQHGRGSFVARGVVADPDLESVALEALRRGQALGHEPDEVAVIAMACASMLGPGEQVVPPDRLAEEEAMAEDSETVEIRQELRRQIGRLEAELSAYVRDLPGLYTASPRAEPHVAGVEELEQTRDTLIAKLSEARQAAEERARQAGRARQRKLDASPPGGPLANASSWWQEQKD